MNDPVRVDKASLDALTETMRSMSAENVSLKDEIDALRADVANLRALLAQQHVGMQDEATEPDGCPVQDGGAGA